MRQWHLIQFKPNAHRLAERNLQRQGFGTFLPMQEFTQRKSSSFISVLRPLFPGYMFVSIEAQATPWRQLNGTIGVSRLISLESKPKPLPLHLISNLMSRCDENGKLISNNSMNTGDNVKVLS